MIVKSFSCQGFTNTSKKHALKNVFLNYYPNVTVLQETLGVGDEVKLSLNRMLPGWTFLTVDTKGRSEGLDLGVKDSSVKLLNSWGLESMVGVEVFSQELCYD